MSKGVGLSNVISLWKSMGKIHESVSNYNSFAQIPAHLYTSQWTDKIVQPMNIQQKIISLKDILGKYTDLSNSVLTPDAKAFVDRFTEDWNPYSFKQLCQTKSLPVVSTMLATSAQMYLGSIATNDNKEGLHKESLYQQMAADLLACTGFYSDDLYITQKIRDYNSNKLTFSMEYEGENVQVVSIPDIIIWKQSENIPIAKGTLGCEIKRKGTFMSQLNQLRGEALAISSMNCLNNFMNPDGSSTIDFICLNGMKLGFAQINFPAGYLQNFLENGSFSSGATLSICDEDLSLLVATQRDQGIRVLCALSQKHKNK